MNREKFLAVISALGVFGAAGAASASTIAQYDFDSVTHSDATHTTVADISGNQHDITWSKSFSLSTNDPFNQAGNNSISATASANGNAANSNTVDLSHNDAFTIEGWIAPSAIGHENQIAYMEGTAGVAHGNYIQLEMDASGHAHAYFRTNTPDSTTTFTDYNITATDTLVTNGWNYLALTFDGTDLTLYELNSSTGNALTEVGSVAATNAKLPTGILSTFFRIANSTSSDAVMFDDIRLSNTVLSDAQLGYHQSFSSVPEPTSLLLLGLGGWFLSRRSRCITGF